MGRPMLGLGEWGTIKCDRRPDGTWTARGRIKDINGNLVRVSRSGPTNAAARENLRSAGREIVHRVDGATITTATTFNQLADLYLEQVKSEHRGSTYDQYAQDLRHCIRPRIGKLPLSRITPSRLQAVFDELRAEGRAPGTLATIRKPVSGALQLAVIEDVLHSNPSRHVRLPSVPAPHHTDGLNKHEIKVLLDAARKDTTIGELELHDFLVLLVSTGARISEILALRWCDVEFDDRNPKRSYLHMRNNIAWVNGQGVTLHPGKTKASRRKVFMTSLVYKVMRRRDEQPHLEDEPLFPVGATLKHRDAATMRTHLKRVYRQVPEVMGEVKQPTHVFRHTAAWIMYEAGMTVVDIANQLGHSSVKMTWDVYLRRGEPSDQAAEALDFS